MTATPDQVIAQIREALESVTVESWAHHRTVVEFLHKLGGFDLRGFPEAREKAAYIAAVNPQNIAVLLAELDSKDAETRCIVADVAKDFRAVNVDAVLSQMGDVVPTLLARAEAAEAENKDLLAELSQSRMEIMGRGEAITILEAERDALRKALEPFAAEAACYDPDTGDGDDSVWATPINFKIRDLRRARTLSGDKS